VGQQQLPDIGIAFAAIPAHFQALGKLLAGTRPGIDGLADLAVCHRFADAHIHNDCLFVVVIFVAYSSAANGFGIGGNGPVNFNAVAFLDWGVQLNQLAENADFLAA